MTMNNPNEVAKPEPQGEAKLFRQEVFDHKKDTLVGKILIDKAMAPLILPAFVIFLLIAGGFLAVFGSYTEKAKAEGFLEPDQGLVRVIATNQGVVKKVFVTQNQVVEENDRLLDLNNEIIGIDGIATNDSIMETLENSLTELRGDLKARLALSQARAETLDETIAGLTLQIASLDSRRAIQRRQTKMFQDQYEKLSSMAERRLIGISQSNNAESSLIGSQAQEAQLNEAVVRLEAELGQAQSQRAQIPTTLALEVSQVQQQMASLEERMVRNEVQTKTTLESPISGTVAYLAVKEAETVGPGVLVATIIPAGSKLQAHLYAVSRDANRAKIGDEVRLKYDAFVYQKYGTYEGKIIGISDSPISQQELPPQFAQNPGEAPEPRFRIIVELSQNYVEKGTEKIELQAGVKLKAEILLRKRPVYSWVLGSLFD